ncbi:MAG: hypothetical protein QOD61_14 [Solirubrobacteraceae bacterium]|jgi:hypothetical protein|nr:hypothetical protein [Solirubrobacteraceae bacterium]
MPRLRPAPWWILFELVTVAHAEWRGLSATDRDKLSRLAIKSRGLPTNLTARERAEIKRILSKIDVKRVAKDMVPKVVRRRTRLR